MRIVLVMTATLAILGIGCTESGPDAGAGEEQAVVPMVPVQKRAQERNPLGCTIRSESECELGRAPKVSVTLSNQTNADVYLVGSLDASDCKWRYPHCYFEVTGPDGKSAVQGAARCGNMNTLREKDFVRVPPGGTFDPYQRVDGYGFFPAHQLSPDTFRMPGEYRIQFVYSTDSNNLFEWGGDGRTEVASDEKLIGMFKQVPKVEVRSNEVKVTVR